eukprot:jgi/Botrbrau1/3307/Bobra.0048s0004.1
MFFPLSHTLHKATVLRQGASPTLLCIHSACVDSPVTWIQAEVGMSEPDCCREQGRELFLFVSFWVLVTVLPVNLVSHPEAAASNFTYWLSPPPPPIPDAPPTPDQPETIQAPDFYVPVPPAPPGIEWWQYANNVPILPDPGLVLGPLYARYGWRYQADYQTQNYVFSNLDKATMSNVAPRSKTLWVHCLATWIVSLYAFRLLWMYSREAVNLRIRFLTSSRKGAQTHTVLVRDVPGILAGTLGDRFESGLLFFVPQQVKAPIKQGVAGSIDLASKGLDATAGRVARTLAPDVQHEKRDHNADQDIPPRVTSGGVVVGTCMTQVLEASKAAFEF